MERLDLPYIVRSLGALSGVPVRLYEGEELRCAFFPVKLPRDPVEVCRKELFSILEHVGFYVSPLFHSYGVVRAGNTRLVIGPASQIMAGEQRLRELAFQLGVPKEETADFLAGMNAIVPMPVESLLQLLCTVNHLLNDGEKLELSEVAIYDAEQRTIKSTVEKRRTERIYEETAPTGERHNTLALEETLMDIVRRGDSAALKSWLASAPAVHGGTMAGDLLRQLRNLFIVTATLASRAAIRGGLREDDAFALSDGYIRRAELLTDYAKIMNLQYHMLLEYTEQVEKLRRGRHPTRLATQAADYVRRHLSEAITVEKMAEEFYMSRPYLSARFRQETGQTLTDYILGEKTEEAKRLLRWSDKSAAAIGAYLGFSSTSHFSRVFKKYVGLTPNEYREKQRV
ncbi:MAG: helix-turn-helix domain-containing protein [Oscillospiraceae bacterium]|nr:helix-turn-helix domain-containing protein [Oscillospiraceae bacterium]